MVKAGRRKFIQKQQKRSKKRQRPIPPPPIWASKLLQKTRKVRPRPFAWIRRTPGSTPRPRTSTPQKEIENTAKTVTGDKAKAEIAEAESAEAEAKIDIAGGRAEQRAAKEALSD